MDLSARLEQTGMDATAIFPNIRALKGVLDLTGKGAADNVKIFDALSNTMGATDEAFNKTSKTASFQVTQGLNAMKTSLLSIGQTILEMVAPAIQKIGAFMTNLSEKFNALSPTVKKMIVVFGGVVAALGPVIAIIGSLLTMAPAIGAALTLMTGPIGLVVAALTAVGVVIYKNWAGIKAALIKVGNYFIELYNNSLPIQLAVDAIIMQFKNLVAVGKFVFSTLVTILKTAGKNIVSILGGVGDIIMGTFTFDPEQIKAGFVKASKGIKDNMISAFNDIKTDAKTLGSSVVDNFNEALEQKQISPIVVPVAVVSAGDGGQAAAGNGTTTTTSGGGGGGRGAVSSVSALESGGIMTPVTNAIKADTAGIPAAIAEQQAALSESQILLLEKAALFQQQAGQIMTSGMQNIVSGMAGAIGGAITSGGNLMGALGGVIIGGIAQIAENLGRAAIKIGLTMKAIKMAFKSPATAIAAGVALIAISKVIQSVIPKIASGEAAAFANGGIVSGPTMGLVGEYPGARQNPEVIAPLNKLQSMIGGAGGGNLTVTGNVRVDGQDLLIAIERANETAGRIY
jgi:hypothetical protein